MTARQRDRERETERGRGRDLDDDGSGGAGLFGRAVQLEELPYPALYCGYYCNSRIW